MTETILAFNVDEMAQWDVQHPPIITMKRLNATFFVALRFGEGLRFESVKQEYEYREAKHESR